MERQMIVVTLEDKNHNILGLIPCWNNNTAITKALKFFDDELNYLESRIECPPDLDIRVHEMPDNEEIKLEVHRERM